MGKTVFIDGLAEMSQQQVFDICVAHVLQTRQQSLSETGTCTYGGIGCAAAPLIKKEYRNQLGGSWPHLHRLGQIDHIAAPHKDFVFEIQLCHDDFGLPGTGKNFIEYFKKRATLVAVKYGLSNHLIEQDNG